MKTAATQDVPHHWQEILRWVREGEEVRLTAEGKPVAWLTPWREEGSFIGATAGGPALPADLDQPIGEKW